MTGPTHDAVGVGERLAAELLDLGAADLMAAQPPLPSAFDGTTDGDRA
jgi:hypothetical protein